MAKGINFYQEIINYISGENKEGEAARALKRKFNIIRTNGITEEELNTISKELLYNYQELKDIQEINEILQLITIEYDSIRNANIDNEKKQKKITQRINDIYIHILGNKGTKSDIFSYKEIEDIIKWKLKETDELLINRNDILNILKDYSNSNKDINMKIYNSLLKNIVIPYIQNDIESIDNPNAINVLKDLALSYKNQGEYENCQKIYIKCIELYKTKEGNTKVMQEELQKLLKDKDEVANYTNQFNKIIDPISINAEIEEKTLTDRFLALDVDNINDLVNVLKKDVDTQIIVADIPGITMTRGSKNYNNYKLDDEIVYDVKNPPMPVRERINGIQNAIKNLNLTIYRIVKFKELNDKNDNEILRELQSKLKDYENYILIGIEELNVSLLECLKEDYTSLQIIPNENLYEILKFEKVRDQKVRGSIQKNHVKDFSINLEKELKNIAKQREKRDLIENDNNEQKSLNDEIEEKTVVSSSLKQGKVVIKKSKIKKPKIQEQVKEFNIKTASMQELNLEGSRLVELLRLKTEELLEARENKEKLRDEVKRLKDQQNEVIHEIYKRMTGKNRDE